MVVKLSDKLEKLLDSPVFATVATIQPDGNPQLSIVWVTRECADVLFAILCGSAKERNLRRDSRATLLVSPADEPYTYATLRGTCSFSIEGRREFIDSLSIKYTGVKYEEFYPNSPKDDEFVITRLVPDRVFEMF